VLLRSRRRPKPGQRIPLGSGRAQAELLEEMGGGAARIRVVSDIPVLDLLEAEGRTPLPPYIRRPAALPEPAEDRERYQTVFASRPGAVAAPTAGLHFTPNLVTQLRRRGVETVEVTLHVGPGTFRPVTADDLTDHRMDSERYEISPDAAWSINMARRMKRRVIAVGTTSVRALETAVRSDGTVASGSGRSELFIHPPYEFGCIGALLTNFHLPRSTLLMLVSAFAGREAMLNAYATAVRERYRFYSYGDCMLIV
jgi:S-adenosylmethionine:tRNA ribosyltransferase-isomerase